MKVKAIRPAGVADVYNMEVDETHDFAVNGGIIAHNCYDELRYVCMDNPIAPRQNKPPALVVYDPLRTDEETYDDYAYYRRFDQ